MQVYKPHVVALLEPRVSGDVGDTVRQKLKFQSSFVVEAQGFSGGIWLLWNESVTKVRILGSSPQYIHASIEWDEGKKFSATFVYASSSLLGRRPLWNDIRTVSGTVSTAWAIMGDLNAMVESSEKRGGAKFNQSPAADFRDSLEIAA
ncbi:hypothetical protein LINPERHAP1_LOCUS17291 [Linum perenne]